MGHGLDRVHGFHHPVATFASGLGRLPGSLGSGHRVACHLLHRGGHFVDRGGRLFDLVVLLLQAAGSLFSDRAEFFRGRGQLGRRAGDLLDGAAQAGLHLGQGLQQPRRLVLAIDLDGLAQVAAGDHLRGIQGLVQGGDDAAGEQQRQNNGQQRGKHSHRHNPGDGAAVVLAGSLGSAPGISSVDRDQLVQLLAHLVCAFLDPRIDQAAHFIQLVLARQFEHLVLRLQVVVQGRSEGLVQRRLLRPRRQGRIAGLGLSGVVHQHADARLGFCQACRLAVHQHTEGKNPQAQHVLGEVAEKADTGQLVAFHVHRGFADHRHAIDRKHPQHHDQQGNEGKTEESTRGDIQVTQGHRTTLEGERATGIHAVEPSAHQGLCRRGAPRCWKSAGLSEISAELELSYG